MKYLLPLFALLLGACASNPPVRTTKHVDLERYAGRWFEIARYPNSFQRKCAGNVTATYTARPDGSIEVVNQCRTSSGATTKSVGRATVVPGSGNAKLEVNFGLPFITGDYWILAFDQKDYRWALVGHPSRKYLWILAREPHISEDLIEKITALATAQGFDPAKLQRTDQSHPQ